MLILYFDLDPCCLSEVTLWVIVEDSLRCLKVIEQPTKDSPLPIEGEYTYGLLLGLLLGNLWPEWKCHEEHLQVHD